MCALDFITPANIGAAKDIILAGAGVFTAIAAIRGLNKWSDELRGKADFEVGRALAKATYRVRDTLSGVRSPFILTGEFPDGYSAMQASDKEKADGLAHVYNQRLKPAFEALREFDTLALEAEALWGAAIKERADELRRCYVTLKTSIESHIDNSAEGGRLYARDQAFRDSVQDTIWDREAPGRPNTFSARVKTAIAAIEVEVRAHLSKP